jgi:hypothetical protein
VSRYQAHTLCKGKGGYSVEDGGSPSPLPRPPTLTSTSPPSPPPTPTHLPSCRKAPADVTDRLSTAKGTVYAIKAVLSDGSHVWYGGEGGATG